MSDNEAEYCQQRIQEEERLAREAAFPEAGEVHFQMALLYRAQLNVLSRRSERMKAEA